MKIAYPARFEPDEDGRVVVTFRDLPEAATDGADINEASAEAVDVLDSALVFRMRYREDVPPPSKPRRGERLVVPDAGVAMKIALYIAMRDRGMTAAELTARLGVNNRETQRILNPHHATRIARMSEAIAATGRRTVIELESVGEGAAVRE